MAYAQTDAGKQLLESLKVEQVPSRAPHGRIILALQAGIVLVLFGAAMLWLRSHLPGETHVPGLPGGDLTVVHSYEGYEVLGVLSIALGLGFALSSAASYYLSKSFGLFNGKRS